MTAYTIHEMTREEKRDILRAMIEAEFPMGSRPKYTAYKVLDREFAPEQEWYWYEKMAEFVNGGKV